MDTHRYSTVSLHYLHILNIDTDTEAAKPTNIMPQRPGRAHSNASGSMLLGSKFLTEYSRDRGSEQ